MSVWTPCFAITKFIIAAVIAGPASLDQAEMGACLRGRRTLSHQALWAADEIRNAPTGNMKSGVPGFATRQRNQINEGLGLGTVDLIHTG
jgi:hypothetical protein